MNDWIKCVLQASKPWISTRDIDKGAIWFSEISDQLKDTAAGIVCLTQENKNKPWILFETGALAKGLSTNRVCTLLIDLFASDVEDPLAQFNHTLPQRASMWGLASSLNACLEANRLDERILKQVFETYWPKFEVDFARALSESVPEEAPEPRSGESILNEILANTRMVTNRVRDLESRLEGFDSIDRFVSHGKDMKLTDIGAMVTDLGLKGRSIETCIKQLIKMGLDEAAASETVELYHPRGLKSRMRNSNSHGSEKTDPLVN